MTKSYKELMDMGWTVPMGNFKIFMHPVGSVWVFREDHESDDDFRERVHRSTPTGTRQAPTALDLEHEKIQKRADEDKRRAVLEDRATEWLKLMGLYQEGMRVNNFRHEPQIVHLEYQAKDMLGVFYLFASFGKYLEFARIFCTQKANSHHWDFPLELREYNRLIKQYGSEDEAAIYPVYPLWFETKESHNVRGRNRAYCSHPSNMFARFGIRTDTGPWTARLTDIAAFDIRIKLPSWEPLEEFGLSYKGWLYKAERGYENKPDAPRTWRYEVAYGKDVHLHPHINGWEYIHFSGGHTYMFIPSGFVWANGIGFEEDLIGYELERG